MTLDTRARATALRLLTKYGKTCTLTHAVQGAYNTATGTQATTTTAYTIKAYLDQPNRQELAGGQVVQGDEVAMFAASGLAIEPAVNDTITVDSKARTVKMVNRVWSGAQVALWRCGVSS